MCVQTNISIYREIFSVSNMYQFLKTYSCSTETKGNWQLISKIITQKSHLWFWKKLLSLPNLKDIHNLGIWNTVKKMVSWQIYLICSCSSVGLVLDRWLRTLSGYCVQEGYSVVRDLTASSYLWHRLNRDKTWQWLERNKCGREWTNVELAWF